MQGGEVLRLQYTTKVCNYVQQWNVDFLMMKLDQIRKMPYAAIATAWEENQFCVICSWSKGIDHLSEIALISMNKGNYKSTNGDVFYSFDEEHLPCLLLFNRINIHSVVMLHNCSINSSCKWNCSVDWRSGFNCALPSSIFPRFYVDN